MLIRFHGERVPFLNGSRHDKAAGFHANQAQRRTEFDFVAVIVLGIKWIMAMLAPYSDP